MRGEARPGAYSGSRPDCRLAATPRARRCARSAGSRSKLPWNWLPRAGGLGIALFLALFALDSFEGQQSHGERASALMMHLLPNFACPGLVAVAWKRPWVGAVGSGTLALG